MRRAVDEFDMIRPGDKIAVGVSGGKDSMLMLYALSLCRKYWRRDFELVGLTVDLGFEGFDTKNRDAFMELWTKNKITLGCKGSGRFTWLKVFKNIDIESDVQNEQCKVNIPFSLDFEERDMSVVKSTIDKNSTIIKFTNVTSTYYNNVSDGRSRIDLRCNADIDEILASIKEYLLIKLFLLKQQGKQFTITIMIDENTRVIN